MLEYGSEGRDWGEVWWLQQLCDTPILFSLFLCLCEASSDDLLDIIVIMLHHSLMFVFL